MSSPRDSEQNQTAAPVSTANQGDNAENPAPLDLSVQPAPLLVSPAVRTVRFSEYITEHPRVVFLEPPSGWFSFLIFNFSESIFIF